MIHFADEALIEVRSGKGGNGCIAFRREKYVPNGGPNGGDGGRGGDVIFCVKKNLRTLSHLRHKQVFKAKNGSDGEGSNRYGRDGEDVYVPVPPGTTIRDAETGELICEFTTESENETFKYLTGGKGGWGNTHFKSSTNQAPKYAHEGKPGETKMLRVELSIMADVGLVGFPNAGKSSLLDYFTNARPKIAPYPFTTKIPNLGVLHVNDERDIIIADIIKSLGDTNARQIDLIFSAHSLPQKVIDKGDLYERHLKDHLEILKSKLNIAKLEFNSVSLAYQSRLGPVKWLGPNLSEVLPSLSSKRAMIYPISFCIDNSETDFELAIEYKHIADDNKFDYYKVVKAPNDSDEFISFIAQNI